MFDEQDDILPSAAAAMVESAGKSRLRLQQAIEHERLVREDATEEEAAYKRQIAADFAVQLATKRGVRLRPAAAGPVANMDLGEDVPGLLAQNPELREIDEEQSYELSEVAARMFWYDELAG